MKTVCICGGGSQGHISIGVIGSNPNFSINVLTRQPNRWSHDFKTIDLDGKEYCTRINKISSAPEDVIPGSDIILICLPGFAILEELDKIKPFVRKGHLIGCVFGGSGFFIALQTVFGTEQPAFALQRVPFTGRPIEYGHSGRLKGYKPYLKVATMNIVKSQEIAMMVEDWYKTPTFLLSHWLEATLSNSNPLLHPCRMYVMFKDWNPEKVYDRIPWMYNTDWDDESSQCWIDCDNELRHIMEKLPMNPFEVPSVLQYYECKDAHELTIKMQNIRPFKTVQAHMNEVNGGYKVDPTVRYFTEDIPFGLILIKSFAEYVNIETPNIDKIISWAQHVMGKEYIVNGKLTGKDLNNACVIKNIQL